MRTDLMNLQAAFNYYKIDSGCVREALQELHKIEQQQKQERQLQIEEQRQQQAARRRRVLGRFFRSPVNRWSICVIGSLHGPRLFERPSSL